MAAVGVHSVIEMERSEGTHPFFQNRSIPHRAVTLPETGDNAEKSSQPAKPKGPKSRKRKSGPLIERPPNAQLPLMILQDSSMDVESAVSLPVEGSVNRTPKKNMLKISSNGKLLSSPPVVLVGLPNADKAVTKSPRATGKHTKPRLAKPRLTSLVVAISYGSKDSDERLRIGSTIDEILSSTPKVDHSRKPSTAKKTRTPKKSTHPFFFGKVKPLPSAADEDGCEKRKDHESDASVSFVKSASRKGSPQSKAAWKDITFSSGKNKVQHNEVAPAPWPPTDMQRVDGLPQARQLRSSFSSIPSYTYKSKGRSTRLCGEEDIMCRAIRAYSEALGGANLWTARHPVRNVLSGQEISCRLEDKLLVDRVHLATQRLKSTLATNMTAFDQGKCDQSSWTTKSSPSNAEEVLQPGSEAVVLRDWVKNLTVTSVECAQPAEKAKVNKPLIRKRGRPKRSGSVDDFIVESEDEADGLTEIDVSTRESSPFIDDIKRSVLRAGAMTSSPDKGQTRNTILLSGPTGCGKTASVYAIARELGFEVFEIHPGSRRGAKEILDRVGDMTQNHLVQHPSGEALAEDVPATPIDEAVVQNEIAAGKQRTMNGFFQSQAKTVSQVGRKRKAGHQDDQKEESTIKKPRKGQKQSLILLEEVDILFDEDKFFWSGVMSLIHQSKRPIILTCNDESELPLDELPLHGILRYSSAPEEVATDYLLTLAASEGHELERDAVSYLYQSQKHDLRATITELNFWCQMGIGSRKGGLDWMLERPSSGKSGLDRTTPRVTSSNTYLRGIGMTPQQADIDPEQLLLDAHQQLNIPLSTWSANADSAIAPSTTIKDASLWADLYSDLDLHQGTPFFDTDTDTNTEDPSDLHLRIIASLTARLIPTPPTPSSIVATYVQPPSPHTPKITRSALSQILAPLTTEKCPTFPLPHGRLAPSLDPSSPLSNITSDIAPYVRSIVAFERKWGAAMLPLVSKRSTRASVKSEGYFSQKLDKAFVERTGGEGWGDLLVMPAVEMGR